MKFAYLVAKSVAHVCLIGLLLPRPVNYTVNCSVTTKRKSYRQKAAIMVAKYKARDKIKLIGLRIY